MSVPIPHLWPNGDHGVEVSYWTPTVALRWCGRVLQQKWASSDGKFEWRQVPDADPFDDTPEEQR